MSSHRSTADLAALAPEGQRYEDALEQVLHDLRLCKSGYAIHDRSDGPTLGDRIRAGLAELHIDVPLRAAARPADGEGLRAMVREITSHHSAGQLVQHYLDFRHAAGEACNWCAALAANPSPEASHE